MKSVDLIRAEQYRLQQSENTADSTGQKAGLMDACLLSAHELIEHVLEVPLPPEYQIRTLVEAGARIAQAIDILRETE